MRRKSRPRSRVLAEVAETARDLHAAGLITKRRLEELRACGCLDVEDMPPARIRALRRRLRLSQAAFAAVLNTSVSTVQKWEAGAKRPSGPSLKLLSVMERRGLDGLA
ncbi:MAG TPA: helix-turn-helix domain-containing protein [Chromatiales bacterium]|nr:helix-turn-helix domain-containing protein [Chromatiales bacterium]